MLLSLVLTLKPTKDCTLPLTTGNFAHACLLNLVRGEEEAMAENLHAQGRDKPFTVSPLQGEFANQNRRLSLKAGSEYWFRTTGVEKDLTELLLRLEGRSPQELELFDAKFNLLKITKEANSWAGITTYEELYNNRIPTDREPERIIKLKFYSPTTFRSGKLNIPLPLPRFIFFGLQEKWNKYSPVFLGEDISRLADEHIHIRRHSINTKMFDFGRYRQVGFVGECEFGVNTTVLDGLFARIINLLADFAFYAGVGYKTTMGMGQVRRVED